MHPKQTEKWKAEKYVGDFYSNQVYKSCLDVQSSESGFYFVKLQKDLTPNLVYCDMDVDGGGWTLVSSIQPNPCTSENKWTKLIATDSRIQPTIEIDDVTEVSNWENFKIFGNIESMAREDYKNSAYFNYQADDVMVWHVTKGADIREISEKAKVKYVTKNKFLRHYGGNLRSLYAEHFPLKETKNVGDLWKLMESLRISCKFLVNSPQWHYYHYDIDDNGDRNEILDGHDDMYDKGNKISIHLNNQPQFPQPLHYNHAYFNTSTHVETVTSTTYPFRMMTWIGNDDVTIESVNVTVESNFGADGDGSVRNHDVTTVVSGDVTLRYASFQVHAAQDPSICEVYFVLGKKQWNSKLSTSGFGIVRMSQITKHAENTVSISGFPQNVLFGYFLLSKKRGEVVRKAEIEKTLRNFLKRSENTDFVFPKKFFAAPQVHLVKGHMRDVMPTSHDDNNEVETGGHVQFRAFDERGFPHAFCPLAKQKSSRENLSWSGNPREFCVGGRSDSCHDFDDYQGRNETILIFTR